MKRPMNLRFFWEKVRFTNLCWEWIGCKWGDRYGMFQGRSAHKVSWFIHNGKEVPAGMQVLHSCDNAGCVNPNHLFLGTQKDNMQDKYQKGRQNVPIGTRNASAKLSEKEVVEIRELYPKFSQSKLASIYGVNQSQISRVVSKLTWSHL